jgi:hypothetical protein
MTTALLILAIWFLFNALIVVLLTPARYPHDPYARTHARPRQPRGDER